MYQSTRFTHRRLRRPVAAASVILAFTSLTEAQSNDDELVFEEIIVTAQLREQNLQEVPVSLAVVDGEALRTRQIDGFDQLQFVVPGINFTAGVNARQSATTIRGIGTSLFNVGIEASVGIVIDGVVMGREGAGIFDFSDIERIEVLRGPQGTLFGKNASAGVISIVTRMPTDEFEATASVGYGSFDEINLSASVAGPLGDGLSARISGYHNVRDGYIENVFAGAPDTDLNERDEFGFRGKIRFEPNESVSLLLSGDYVSRDQASGALTLRSVSSGGPGTGLLGFGVPVVGPVSIANGVTPGPDNLQIASEGAFFNDMEAYGVSLEGRFSLGEYELISISAWRNWKSDDNNDADLIPLPFLAENLGSLDQEQFSQELRLQSPQLNRFSYLVGAYFFDQDIRQNNIQAGTAGLDLLGVLPPGLLLGTDLRSRFEEQNYALFGQAEFDLTEKLTLIGGARLLRSEIAGSQSRSVAEGAIGPFAGQNVTATPQTAEQNDTALVWRLGLQYFVNDDVNLFATASRGYKSGGIVQGLTVSPLSADSTTLPTVVPERPTQFEAGIRSSFLDQRVTFNLTTFYAEFENFQAQALIPGENGTNIFSVTNAGEVETYGFEADISVYPVEGLTLSTAIAYTDATYKSFEQAPCFALQPVGPDACVDTNGDGAGEFQNLDGASVAQSPDWVINSLARYDFDISSTMGSFVQIGGQYQSGRIASNVNDPRTLIDSRFLLDAQVGFTFDDNRYQLTFFGRNLTKERFPESLVGAPFDTGGVAQFLTLENFRTWGVRLTANL